METVHNLTVTFLLNAAWQIPCIGLLAWLSDKLLRKVSAKYRHLLWLTALLLALMLPVLSLKAGSDETSQLVPVPSISAAAKTEKQSPALPQTESPGHGENSPAVSSKASAATSNAPISPVEKSVEPPQVRRGTVHLSYWLILRLSLLFMVLLTFSSLRFARDWWAVQKLRMSAYQRTPGDRAIAVITQCQAKFRLGRIQVLFSQKTKAPLTLGVFRPIVILPEELVKESSTEILVSTIGHELAHIKRADFLLGLLVELVSIPILFHPVSWFLKERIRFTRELACDEMVSSNLIDRRHYADSLLELARRCLPKEPSLAPGVFDSRSLERRIKTLVTRRTSLMKESGQRWTLLATCILLITGSFSLLGLSRTTQSLAAEPKETTRKPLGLSKNELLNRFFGPDFKQGYPLFARFTNSYHIVRAGNGGYYSLQPDQSLEKYDWSGKLLWRLQMGSLLQPAELCLTGFDVSPSGEIFLVGKTDSQMILYRVSEIDRQPEAELLGQYPGFQPVSIAVAPDKSLYICAYETDPIKEAEETDTVFYGRRETRINNLPFIHKFAPEGKKLATVMWTKLAFRDFYELTQKLRILQCTELTVDSRGNLYTYNRLTDTSLHKILPEKGLQVGSVPLPYVGFRAGLDPAALATVDFVNEKQILYTVLLFESRGLARTPVGYQVRTFDLTSGSSKTLADGSKPSMFEGHYSFRLDSAFLIGASEEDAQLELSELAEFP